MGGPEGCWGSFPHRVPRLLEMPWCTVDLRPLDTWTH